MLFMNKFSEFLRFLLSKSPLNRGTINAERAKNVEVIEKLEKEKKISNLPKQGPELAERIIDACEKYWEVHKSNCSGLVNAVADEFEVVLTGQANDIVDQIQNPPWKLLSDGVEADKKASEGKLVVAGLKSNPNGHVVIVVKRNKNQELAHGKYPFAYWGQLNGIGRKMVTINYAWFKEDRDKVIYHYRDI